MKIGFRMVLMASLTACSSDECVDEDGCEEGLVSYEPTGDVGVTVKWTESTQLEVNIAGVSRGYFGIVEAGMGATGWYGEDCPEGPFCHELITEDDLFEGTHYLVSVNGVGQENWDGTLDVGQTWMHRDGLEKQVWALFSWDGRCLKMGGEDETLYEYYSAKACPR